MDSPQADAKAPLDAAQTRRKRTLTAALILIISAAALLRLVGITWGLPDETHLFSYHPDEYFSLSAALYLFFGEGPNPHFFNYPSLYLYLVAAACMAAHGYMPLERIEQLPEVLRAFTLDARLVTVGLALGTVLVTYAIGKRLAGRRAGLVAAALVAVMPGHVLYSHFAAVDIALTLFIALALYVAMALASDERLKTAAIAGVSVGAAAATKYNGALALLMPLIVLGQGWVKRRDGRKSAVVRMAAVVLLAALAFCVLSPYVLLDWQSASHAIAYERNHMTQGEYPAKAADPCGWWFHARALAYSVGGSVPLVLILGLFGYGMRGRIAAMAPLLVFALLWYLIIGATGVRYARYGLPLIPLLAVGAAAGVANLAPLKRSWFQWIAAAVVCLPGLFTSSVLSTEMRMTDPRDAALIAMPREGTVGLGRAPWFDMPPFDYNNGATALGNMEPWRSFHRSEWDLEIIDHMDADDLRAKRPEWFVESPFQYADWIRAGDEQALAFREALESDYTLARVLTRHGGWRVLGPCGPVPHDFSYPFVEINIWRLKSEPER